MTDKFDAAIQEIAIKHGVLLSKDDPILILQTMNDRLIEETQQAQAAMLAQYREEMEAISSQWKDDAKEKAEKVLNAALASSKEAMSRLLHETIEEIIMELKKITSDLLVRANENSKKSQKYVLFLFIGFVATFLGSCMFITHAFATG
ncbi:conjugal transfer protein TraM [Legionella pneumophila serogroup 1]